MWYALLGAPLSWALGFTIKYSVVPFACGADSQLAINIISAITLVLTLLPGLVAWRVWQLAGHDIPDESPSPIGRTRFVGMIGMLASALFTLVVLAQWISSAFLNPCMAI
jgi:hypothetical protein